MAQRSDKPAHGDSAEEDARLFREAVRDVRPLRERAPRASARARARPARARFAAADRAAVLLESLAPAAHGAEPPETGDELVFARPGVPGAVLRKLRRGQFRIEAELDLHGLTLAQARPALLEFVAQAVGRGARCLRIVHGKGLGSGARGPVLRGLVGSLLPRLDVVLAFAGAREVDGGSGATLVLLAPGAVRSTRAGRSPSQRAPRSGR